MSDIQSNGKIGDRVWADTNKNGVQDAGELGMAGVKVTLVTAGADGIIGTADDVGVRSQLTDANGYYLFDQLEVGDYQIKFGPVAGMQLTTADQGGNDLTDSDADAITGRTGKITLGFDQINLTVDAGFAPIQHAIVVGVVGCQLGKAVS